MSDGAKKKSLWQLLNTPVQDLIKKDEGPESPAITATAAPLKQPEPAGVAEPAATVSAVPEPVEQPQAVAMPVTEPMASSEPQAEASEALIPEAQEMKAEPFKEPEPQELKPDELESEVPGSVLAEAVEEPALVEQITQALPEVAKPEALEPEVLEPEVLEPEVLEPEVLEPEVLEPEVAELEVVEPASQIGVPPVEEVLELEPSEPETVQAESKPSEETPKLRKKSLWELLNTPVQDLFTEEGQLTVAESEDEVAFLGLGRDKPELEGKEKASWLTHFRNRLARTRGQFTESINRLAKGRTKVDEDMLEELEEILLQSDVGIKTTDDVLEYLRGEAKKRRFLPEEVLPSLTAYLEQTLESESFRIEEGRLNIFLIVGVNGTGKTTTVGKVAAKLKIAGYKIMLAAGDTFRAAAIEQLGVWGKRVGCPVIQHHEGADAAAVVYDAIQSARAKKIDALLIDTAGRLHNKDHLMEELKKVYRIIEREKQDAHVECILVLDATTGQNGLRQAEVFSKSVPLNSLILTKLDGTAKGGVIFGIKRELGIPIKLLGVGEHLGDLQEFEPKSFVQALFAQEDGAEAEALETSGA